MLSKKGVFTISGCYFENNKADTSGALYFSLEGKIILEKNIFIANKAVLYNAIACCSAICIAKSQIIQIFMKNIYYLNSAQNKGSIHNKKRKKVNNNINIGTSCAMNTKIQEFESIYIGILKLKKDSIYYRKLCFCSCRLDFS